MHFPLSSFIILIFCIASIRAQPAYLNDVKSADILRNGVITLVQTIYGVVAELEREINQKIYGNRE